MSKRIRIVSSSTFAREIRTSPATTRPLSRMRSRMSTRLVPWFPRRGSRLTNAQRSQKVSEGSQVDIEVAGPKPELLGELVHFFFQLHQCESDALHLLISETAALHAAHGLAFEQLPQELDQRQHKLSQPLLYT